MVVEHREEIKFKFNSKQRYNFFKKYKLDYPLYEKRKVNSLYFDTIGFDIYKNSQFQDIGVEKVRLRYYGENESSVTKEVKVSTPLGKRKYSEPMSKNLNEYKKGLFHGNNILYPVTHVSYQRDYYSFEECRITIDTDIKFTTTFNRNRIFRSKFENYSIVEFKLLNPFNNDIVKNLPTNPISYSKFKNSIQKLYFYDD